MALTPPQGAPAAPRLVVIIVIDQMRADYVTRFRDNWTRGFKRLIDRGAWFTNAAYPYLTTVTCAGHATVATGTFPRTHGVFQNAWYDRSGQRLVTCTEDPTAEVLSYRESNGIETADWTAHGAGESGARLRVPTLGDVLRERRGGRVVTIALKGRSAVMLAGHGGDAVTWLDESLDRWETSTAFSPGPVPAVQSFLRGNSPDIDFGRIWAPLLTPRAYSGADAGLGEAPPRGWTARFPHALTGLGGSAPGRSFRDQWAASPFADAYVGRFAAETAEALHLGTRTTIDFLGVGFSSSDLAGHAFGPRSHEVQDLYVHLDRTLGDLFDRLDRLAGPGQWIVALTGDHGVAMLPEQAPVGTSGRVSTRVVADAIESTLRAALGPAAGNYVARVNGNDVYFASGVYDRLASTPTLAAVVERLESQPGIARVFRRDQLATPGHPTDRLRAAAALSYVASNSGDLVYALKPGWTFSAAGVGHGTANPDDQRVPILMMGPGIEPGRYGDPATPADIAPTLAALIGVTMADVEGNVLKSALLP